MMLVDTKQYSTTMSLSIMNNLLVTQRLRRGDGPISYPKSRRAERLFGSEGRTKRQSSKIKLEKLETSYEPRLDTCIKAFVRAIARAVQQIIEAVVEEEPGVT